MDGPRSQWVRRSWSAARLVPPFSGLALTLALGCTHLKETQPAIESPALADAAAKPEKNGPKRQPLPATCVAFGTFRAKAALDSHVPPAEKQSMRDQARKAYQQALTIDSKCLAAYLGLASLYQDVEDYDRALATYQKGLKVLPKEPSLWYELGLCQARHKDFDEAIFSLRTATELDPENHTYSNGLGFSLARAGRVDESYSYFERELGEAKAHYNLARMLHHLKREDECKEHLRMALKANPALESAQKFLAELAASSDPASPAVRVSFESTEDGNFLEINANHATGSAPTSTP